MMPQPARRTERLTPEAIVDAALDVIAAEGMAKLSMRRLGLELGVDPMAVYHHVGSKRALLTLVLARVVDQINVPKASLNWDERVRSWALSYWDVVATHREIIAAALADAEIAAGARPAMSALIDAVTDSGIAPTLVEPNVWLVVDAVHGSALAGGVAGVRTSSESRRRLRAAFATGIETIVAGIAAQSASGRRRQHPAPRTNAVR